MVMETPGPQDVGREFVRQYYTMLHEAPHQLHRFYSNNSAFVHGGMEKVLNEQPAVVGQEAIHKKIVSLNFHDCHAKIRQVDAQATVGDSVVVQVTGELSNNGEPMRRFMQSFVLVPQSPKKFYVHNDIFRYQDEVYHDDDGDQDEAEVCFSVNVSDSREEPESGSGSEPSSASPNVSSYYDQVPLSNGTVHVEVEPLKAVEPAALPPAQPTPPKPEPEPIVAPVEEELPAAPVSMTTQEKVEPAPVPLPEPTVVEIQEPAPEPKPVTWAALASKNTASNMVPPASAFPAPSLGHSSKPPVVRSEPPKTAASSQAPQAQRAPRAPRERFMDRERNSQSRGDGDADSDMNGRRSNSAGGMGGLGGSKYPDSQQVFVGNLPTSVTEAELKSFFEQYGKVEELRINTKSAGKTPNFGFVVFESANTVVEILKKEDVYFNGKHRLNVEEKKPRTSDTRGGRGGMSRGGMGGPGMGRSGAPYSDRGRGGMKGGFNNRQDMRGSPNLGIRGGMGQQGRR